MEGRFNIVQPRELGAAANAVLGTNEMLGTDLRFAAMTFGRAGEGSWEVEYGSTLGDVQGLYTDQKATRHRMALTAHNTLIPTKERKRKSPQFIGGRCHGSSGGAPGAVERQRQRLIEPSARDGTV